MAQIDRSRRDILFGTKVGALAHRSREIYCAENFTIAQICRQTPRAPTRASRMRGATESNARIVVVYPMECDHIDVTRVISHEVAVSECITLLTLHRRFRPGTACIGLILKKYSSQNP